MHAIAFRLRALVRVHRADSHLHEMAREPVLHDARERTRVREAVALEVGVEIGVRIDLKDREIVHARAERPEHRIGDGVVAAEREWAAAAIEDVANAGFDEAARVVGVGKREVALIDESRRAEHVESILGASVRLRRVELLANARRRGEGAAHEGGAGVVRESDECGARVHGYPAHFLRDRIVGHGRQMVVTKRVYEPAAPSDGYRVLIDRLWPRGVSKAKAQLDAWEKDVAPSAELRKWYEHDPSKWPEFQKRYKQELKSASAKSVLDDLVSRAKRGRVTLVYASKAAEISDVAVLEKLLRQRLKR